MDRSKKNPKNNSFGVFTSHSAVDTKSAHDVKRLYFTSTANGDFQKWDTSRDDSMAEVYHLGHKSTKHLNFRYRQTPTHDMGAFSYTKDYYQKPSDSGLNNALAEMFSRPHQGWVGSPTVAPGSYALDFVRHPKHILDAMGQPRKAGGRGGVKRDLARTKVLSPSDATHVTSSSSHQFHMAPPDGLNIPSKTHNPHDNLNCSGLDSGDCYKSTYGTTFRGISRCSTAPASMSRKDAREQQKTLLPQELARSMERPSTSTGSERRKSIRNIFTRTGG